MYILPCHHDSQSQQFLSSEPANPSCGAHQLMAAARVCDLCRGKASATSERAVASCTQCHHVFLVCRACAHKLQACPSPEHSHQMQREDLMCAVHTASRAVGFCTTDRRLACTRCVQPAGPCGRHATRVWVLGATKSESVAVDFTSSAPDDAAAQAKVCLPLSARSPDSSYSESPFLTCLRC